jgi:hypothetical protein
MEKVSGRNITAAAQDSGLSPPLQNSSAEVSPAAAGRRLVEMSPEELDRLFDELLLLVNCDTEPQ